MKNKLFSIGLFIPFFFLAISPDLPSAAPIKEFACIPTTTGSWTITYSQIDPAPCGTMTITATYNGGFDPAPGDITITKILNSNVGATPNPVVGSIPASTNNFTVGTMTFTNNTVNTQNFRLTASVTGGHTITNPVKNTFIETCL